MSILLEALDLVLESVSADTLYNEIKTSIADSEVGVERDGFVTKSWLAGLMNSRGSHQGKMASAVMALDAQRLDPETKDYRDAIRAKIAFEALARRGLVKREAGGRYIFPSKNDKERLAKLSSLRQALASNLNSDKVSSDLGKATRETKYTIDHEWAASLDTNRKRMLDAYTELSVEALNMLWSFVTVKGPTDVASFRKRVNDAKFSGSNDFSILKKIGFINEKDLLNTGLVKLFINFINDPDGTGVDNGWERLLPFNPELTNLTRRITGAQARARNAAGRELNHLRDPDAAQTPDEMNPDENRAMNSRIRDIENGTKSSTRNDRARDQKRNFSDVFKSSFN